MLFVLFESVLLVIFGILEERKTCLWKHQEKDKFLGSFLPWIIGVGKGSTGGNSTQRCSILTHCWQHLCNERCCCWNDVSEMNATHQDSVKKGLSGEEGKCETLFTKSKLGTISVASDGHMSSKDWVRNQSFDTDLSELFQLHTAASLNL